MSALKFFINALAAFGGQFWSAPMFRAIGYHGFVPPSQRSRFSGVARAKRAARKARRSRK
jgi:hypothetical protein